MFFLFLARILSIKFITRIDYFFCETCESEKLEFLFDLGHTYLVRR